MQAVIDRIVQYPNRYQLTNVETQEVLGTFDFDEVTGTVQQVGTEINKALFDSIATDLAARVVSAGGELSGTIVTFSDISGTAENVASGDTSATLWGKVKNWFSRLKALAFKNKVAAGDFEAGAIKNADVAADAAIAQSKVSGLMTDYVASISVSGRTVTYKNKNGVDMGSITTQDTTYGLASQSSNGLMSSTDKTKLDGIESGAQKNTVLGVKGGSESAYRTGNVNITKANIGLGNVDNTSDEDKPVSKATQTALNGKANTSGTYPNLTVGKATNADNATNATNATKATQDASGNVITSTYATKSELSSGLSGKANTSGSYPNLTVGKATNADNATNATKATQDGNGNNIAGTYATKTELSEGLAEKANTSGYYLDLQVGRADRSNRAEMAGSATKATYDSDDNNIAGTYAKQNGNYPNMTVGNATNAVKATQDSNGNNIADTYAQKNNLLVAHYITVDLANTFHFVCTLINKSTTSIGSKRTLLQALQDIGNSKGVAANGFLFHPQKGGVIYEIIALSSIKLRIRTVATPDVGSVNTFEYDSSDIGITVGDVVVSY